MNEKNIYKSGREVFIDINKLAQARMTAAVFIFLFHLIQKKKKTKRNQTFSGITIPLFKAN